MFTASDRYGDLGWEDETDPLDGLELEPDDGHSVDLDLVQQRGEENSFEEDFGKELDSVMDEEDYIEPDESEFDQIEEENDMLVWLISEDNP